jgi:hypothetical protein
MLGLWSLLVSFMVVLRGFYWYPTTTTPEWISTKDVRPVFLIFEIGSGAKWFIEEYYDFGRYVKEGGPVKTDVEDFFLFHSHVTVALEKLKEIKGLKPPLEFYKAISVKDCYSIRKDDYGQIVLSWQFSIVNLGKVKEPDFYICLDISIRTLRQGLYYGINKFIVFIDEKEAENFVNNKEILDYIGEYSD